MPVEATGGHATTLSRDPSLPFYMPTWEARWVPSPGGITAALHRHLRWQRQLLAQPERAAGTRFLVLRPGDKFTVCSERGMDNVRRHCRRGAAPKSSAASTRPGAHWDEVMTAGQPGLTRPVPGLGNVALSLVSAAVAAMLSHRVLLLENYTTAAGSFGAPLTELLVETSGWAPRLARAQARSRVDAFAAHDDFSAFDQLCAADLRRAPSARVWRVFSNQYFLPLLLLNPHHAAEVESLAEFGGRRAREAYVT